MHLPTRLPPSLRRRLLLAWPLGLALPSQAANDVATALRNGGVVIGIRHSLAPGTFDPPGFKLGDCSTQRNLSEEGRAHARRLGQWFRDQRLSPAAVRTSPWCRCADTAELAFGQATTWAALGSPVGTTETTQARQLDELREAMAAVGRQAGRFEAWVTHMFVLRDLAGASTSSGEGLVMTWRDGRVQVLARLVVA